MIAWSSNNPHHKDGNLGMRSLGYGLTPGRVKAVFGPYLERYGDPCTAPAGLTRRQKGGYRAELGRERPSESRRGETSYEAAG